MGVKIIPAKAVVTPTVEPLIMDLTWDYKEDEESFYARSDIDHKVYIPDTQAIWVKPDTGEMKTDWK
jgi:hypothetical protein